MAVVTNHQAILDCFRSGQMSARQWQAHLDDPVFREWLGRPIDAEDDEEERLYVAEAAAALDDVFDNGVR